MATAAIQVSGLTHGYGRTSVLESVEFEVATGEITGLFGPNGSGKTTTLRILCGLCAPRSGTVAILGKPVQRALSRVGVMLEQPVFYPRLNALDNLAFALAFSGLPPANGSCKRSSPR